MKKSRKLWLVTLLSLGIVGCSNNEKSVDKIEGDNTDTEEKVMLLEECEPLDEIKNMNYFDDFIQLGDIVLPTTGTVTEFISKLETSEFDFETTYNPEAILVAEDKGNMDFVISYKGNDIVEVFLENKAKESKNAKDCYIHLVRPTDYEHGCEGVFYPKGYESNGSNVPTYFDMIEIIKKEGIEYHEDEGKYGLEIHLYFGEFLNISPTVVLKNGVRIRYDAETGKPLEYEIEKRER